MSGTSRPVSRGLLSEVDPKELKLIRVAIRRKNVPSMGQSSSPLERDIDDPAKIIPSVHIRKDGDSPPSVPVFGPGIRVNHAAVPADPPDRRFVVNDATGVLEDRRRSRSPSRSPRRLRRERTRSRSRERYRRRLRSPSWERRRRSVTPLRPGEYRPNHPDLKTRGRRRSRSGSPPEHKPVRSRSRDRPDKPRRSPQPSTSRNDRRSPSPYRHRRKSRSRSPYRRISSPPSRYRHSPTRKRPVSPPAGYRDHMMKYSFYDPYWVPMEAMQGPFMPMEAMRPSFMPRFFPPVPRMPFYVQPPRKPPFQYNQPRPPFRVPANAGTVATVTPSAAAASGVSLVEVTEAEGARVESTGRDDGGGGEVNSTNASA